MIKIFRKINEAVDSARYHSRRRRHRDRVLHEKKGKYTQQTMFLDTPKLGPVLRSPNSETMDVLEYSLGGFGGSPQKNC